MSAESIFLVGLMGAGKTTVGKILAKRLQRQFFDSDHEIERRTGVKIPVIFELEGEAGFRSRESAVLEELTAIPGVVLATGGGVVISEQNRAHLKERGFTIYLCASPEDVWRRTRHDKNRPLLQTPNPLTRLIELHRARDPLYREVARLVVDTGEQSVQKLVRRIEQLLPETSESLLEEIPYTAKD